MTVFCKFQSETEPKPATSGSACYDLTSAESATIEPGETAMVRTGLRIQIPTDCEGLVRGRSGLALAGIAVHAGTIDADYRGEVAVIITNHGTAPYVVVRGDRIAQLAVRRFEPVLLVRGELDYSGRGEGGFGSTGR